MELATTVISLAVAVKELSDMATENVTLCQSLGRRAELIPRMLEKFPDMTEIDDKILINLFDILKKSHDLISQYRKVGAIMRFLRAGSLKDRFNELEDAIAKSIDELSLCIGISSAAKIESIRLDFKNQFYDSKVADAEEPANVIMCRDHKVDYNALSFELKRGVRKEIGHSEHNRDYVATLETRHVCVREPVLPPGPLDACIVERWWRGVNTWAELSHDSIWPVRGGGTEYMDEESSPPEAVPQLFVVFDGRPVCTLAEHMASSEGLSIEDVLRHAHSLAAGLHYLHSCSPRLIHGALCPENIVLDGEGRCRISNVLLRREQLHAGAAGGTVDSRWLAPEQAKGGLATCPSDMYTLGLVLCFLLTGKAPYDSSCPGIREAHEAVVTGVRPDIPRTEAFLEELIGFCLGVEPSARPTALSVSRALLAACKEKGLMLVGADSEGGAAADQESSDCCGDVGDFGEMSDRVENIAAAVRIFGREGTASYGGDNGGEPSVVIYGEKVVVLDWNVSDVEKAHAVSRSADGDDDEEEEGDGGMLASHNMSLERLGDARVCEGTVIFHIDCTASMKKNDRMELTKEVLLRVIPSLLRQGLRVLVNSWASNDETKGRVQTREVILPDQSLLELDMAEELMALIQRTAFEILIPAGRTDLYGSCFQLLRQCRELISQAKPIYAFVLTDGNHNRLDYPHHRPSQPGEDYFGVYKAVLQGGAKFGPSHNTFSTDYAEEFLKTELNALYGLCDRTNEGHCEANALVSLTVIGIGDASTKSLSSLTTRLGDRCCFYGITEVSQADTAFGNISVGMGGMTATVSFPGLQSVPLTYTVNSGDVMSGCGVVKDNTQVDGVHQCESVNLSYKNKGIELRVVVPTYEHTVLMSIQEFVAAIRQIRAECYDVTSDSIQSVFKQLLADKQAIWAVKTSFFSKKTRNLRNFTAFAGIGVWIRELEDMIDAQITSFRMNVEGEVLQGLAGKPDDGTLPAEKYFLPSEVVLERLQHNVRFV